MMKGTTTAVVMRMAKVLVIMTMAEVIMAERNL